MPKSTLNSQSGEQSLRRIHLLVRGVQGVGFRPYVYQLASLFSLGGFVLNTGEGVVIEVEGLPSAVEQFLEALPQDTRILRARAGLHETPLPCETAGGGA